jgi:hypothetical protein
MNNLVGRTRIARAVWASTALWVALLVSTSSSAWAIEGNQLPVTGVVKEGDACPITPVSALPAFRQGDVVSLCFGAALPAGTSSDIKVGDMPAMVGQASANSVLVGLPDEPKPGEYVVSGKVNDTAFTPFLIRFFPTPKARITDVSPTATTRGKPVRINGEGLAAPVSAIKVWFGDDQAMVNDVAPDGTWVIATLPTDPSASTGGPRPVLVTVWDLPANAPSGGVSESIMQPVEARLTAIIVAAALAPVVLVSLLVAWVFWSRRRTPGGRSQNLIAALLYDDSTQTYSLSKAQFYWWLVIIAFAYAFLFVGRGVTAGKWEFPPLNGLLGTMAISTLTVLGAIITSNVRGQKGSGAVHPAPSDLIMHGGVIAPERVQQLLWTVLAGLALLWIVFSTYTSEATLPDIPQELLLLMGLSSAAYVGGKIVRSPGPIIRQVDVDPKSKPEAVELLVSGDNLDKDATVALDGGLLPRTNIKVEPAAPPAGQPAAAMTSGQDIAQASQQLVSKLRLVTTISAAAWNDSRHSIVLVNSDGQRSEWPTSDVAANAARALPLADGSENKGHATDRD